MDGIFASGLPLCLFFQSDVALIRRGTNYCCMRDGFRFNFRKRSKDYLPSHLLLPVHDHRCRCPAQCLTQCCAELTSTVSLLRDVEKHISKYPSKVVDSGTHERFKIHSWPGRWTPALLPQSTGVRFTLQLTNEPMTGLLFATMSRRRMWVISAYLQKDHIITSTLQNLCCWRV